MKNHFNIFISHCATDAIVAKNVAEALNILSLHQFHTWFSSSEEIDEGLMPGDMWFQRICNEILQSDVLIVILTPNSISRPWIYYEVGIAQGRKDCAIMPICIGMNKDEIPTPLNNYQLYQLSDYNSAKSLVKHLFAKFSISFIEDMFQDRIKALVLNTERNLIIQQNDNSQKLDVNEVLETLKNHVDKRFFEIANMGYKHIKNKPIYSYSINIENLLDKTSKLQYIEIQASDSVQDVLDRIYFLADNAIDAYTYMQTWILQNKHSGAKMVMYEITNSVSAMQVFKPNSTWQMIRLTKPYTAKKSLYHEGNGLKR